MVRRAQSFPHHSVLCIALLAVGDLTAWAAVTIGSANRKVNYANQISNEQPVSCEAQLAEQYKHFLR